MFIAKSTNLKLFDCCDEIVKLVDTNLRQLILIFDVVFFLTIQFFQVRMDEEIQQLLKDIQRIGDPEEPSVTFGVLFDDDGVANYYEALVGTLKAAKKKGLIKYDGQFLLKGINDNVVISLV